MRKRREFCTVLAGGLTALSGCAAVDDIVNEANKQEPTEKPAKTTNSGFTQDVSPNPVVDEVWAPESQLVSVDQLNQNEFTVTIQNTGSDGNIAVALFWQMKDDATEPKHVKSPQYGLQRERKQELYFNSEERRTVEMTASPPDGASSFHFMTQPVTHGATIVNNGGSGVVNVDFSYETPLLNSEKTREKSVNMDEGEEKDTTFEIIVAPDIEWEISVESALEDI